MTSNQKDILDQSGKEYVIIPDNILHKLHSETDLNGQHMGTADSVLEGYRDSFQYQFIQYNALSATEKKVFETAEWACTFCNASRYLQKIAVSETIRPTPAGDDVLGEWDALNQKIVIRRDQLKSERAFLGTLIHELIHATTGFGDISRDFELALTNVIGELAQNSLSQPSEKKSSFWRKLFR